MNIQQKAKLASYINFHSSAVSSNINTIQAIVSREDVKKELSEAFDLIRKDWVTVKYSKNTEAGKFIESLLWPLYQGKTILIETNTLDFDPIVYDQLIQFRDNNKFTLSFAQGVPVSPRASIFLSYQGKDDENKIWEIADSVIRVDETN